MRGGVIDIAGFEAKFRADPDPWNYRTSSFEAYKRRVLLHACGTRRFGRALELACANGETTRALARRCLRLLAVDGSPAAIEAARARTGDLPQVTLREAALPGQMPRGPFDLIVVSELLYYLDQRDFSDLLGRIERSLAPGGRAVVLHHVIGFDDAAMHPRMAQDRAVAALRRRCRLTFYRNSYPFAVAVMTRRRG